MEKKEDFIIPEDTAEWIGLKKSQYLSELIQKQVPGDFGFEEFHLYDEKIPGTIEAPDKAYEFLEDGQKIRMYLRSYMEKKAYHQLVIGVVIEDKTTSVFVPIISFVSRFEELVREFVKGDVISRPTLN